MKRLASVFGLLLAVWTGFGQAAASCSIVSAGGTLVDFGRYNALEGNRDVNGQVEILCVPDLLVSPTVSYTLSVGAGMSGSFNPRRMTSGFAELEYNLYRDAARTEVLGDGTLGTERASGTCAASCGIPVYGRIFAGQVLPGGSYSDSVLVTLEF